MAELKPTWFAGICDDLLKKVFYWNTFYSQGEVHSTRQFLDLDGNLVDKPTKFAHNVPFRKQELDYLEKIVNFSRPGSPLAEEVSKLKLLWSKGKPVMGNRFGSSYWTKLVLPNGMHRVLNLAFYPEHVSELLTILAEAKAGQRAEVTDAAVEERSREGKGLFEV